jgi:putative ABC transport system ATP-binding protein
LDSTTGILVLEALVEANRTTGATTLIITHNAAIRQIADRTLRFADGRIVEEIRNTTRLRPDQVSW